MSAGCGQLGERLGQRLSGSHAGGARHHQPESVGGDDESPIDVAVSDRGPSSGLGPVGLKPERAREVGAQPGLQLTDLWGTSDDGDWEAVRTGLVKSGQERSGKAHRQDQPGYRSDQQALLWLAHLRLAHLGPPNQLPTTVDLMVDSDRHPVNTCWPTAVG